MARVLGGGVLFLLAAGLLLLGAVQVMNAPAVTDALTRAVQSSEVIYHEHAVDRHGMEAELVRQAYELCRANGETPLQIWQKKGSDRFHCLFELPGGKIGDMVCALTGGCSEIHEVTSFARAEPLADIQTLLSREAVLLFTKVVLE